MNRSMDAMERQASEPPQPPSSGTPEPFSRQDLLAATIRKLLDRRTGAARELALLDMQLEYLCYDLCSTKDEPQDVEAYDGTLGVSKDFVRRYERPVGQLQWVDLTAPAFAKRFSGDDQGNVSGQRWGTGALISDDLFLTAGHCFEREFRTFQVPRKNGVAISSEEIAPLMRVNFNFQRIGITEETRPETSYPILNLEEISLGSLDYAIVRLGRDKNGKLPGHAFGKLAVARNDLMTKNAILCIIQHPDRQEKMVEAGHLLETSGGRISYNDIGTSGGASGAPVLDADGQIVGVHIRGGSQPIGGFNSGTAIGAIRAVSRLLAVDGKL
jgi:V8-like Glu-specific endopeptidase